MITHLNLIVFPLFMHCWVSGYETLSDELSDSSDYFKNNQYDQVKVLLNEYHKKLATKRGQYKSGDPAGNNRSPVPTNDGTEYDSNLAICGDLLECDITLTVEQAKQLVDGVDGTQRVKRKVIKDNFYRWTSPTIPYSIDVSDAVTVDSIRKAISHWEENTCLKFVESVGSNDDYIYFVRGRGCYSNIGRTGGKQQISIGEGCGKMGIVAHEIGHALGFWHEQSRSDRENYVTVNSENILGGSEGNFEKRTLSDSDNYNTAYDIGSVMHYSSKAFSWNGKNTITTKDPFATNTIGQREALSFTDIKLINKIYCSSVCSSSANLCQNGGYPDPSSGGNYCATCKCPSGYGGLTCETADITNGVCGANMEAGTEWATLEGSEKCNWVINNLSGSGKIVIDVESVSVYCQTVCGSYLEIKTGPNFEPTGNRYCCSIPSNHIVSYGSEVIIMFNPGSSGSFKLRYRIEGSDTVLTTSRPFRKPTLEPNGMISPASTDSPIPPGGLWSAWSEWTTCSSTCGMCGMRARTRECSGISCTAGSISEHRPCGYRACSRSTNRRPKPRPRPSKKSNCQKTVNLPCAFLQLLHLNSDSAIDLDSTTEQFMVDDLFPNNEMFDFSGDLSNFVTLGENDIVQQLQDILQRTKRQASESDTVIGSWTMTSTWSSWSSGEWPMPITSQEIPSFGLCPLKVQTTCRTNEDTEEEIVFDQVYDDQDLFCCGAYTVSDLVCV